MNHGEQAPMSVPKALWVDSISSELSAPFDLVVADASWTWTERLFAPLASKGANVLLLRACDWRTAREQRRPWSDWTLPRTEISQSLWIQTLVLPPGWMKTYPRLGMKPVAWAIRSWRKSIRSNRPLVLAISYPHYLYLRDIVKPDALIYYNMDDYALYWPKHASIVQSLEKQAVEFADLSVFCAQIRAEQLLEEVPQASGRIIHLPHGAPEESIAPEPIDTPAIGPPDLERLPRPYLGFVGSLEDRIDWLLLEKLARSRPDCSLILIGRRPPPSSSPWFSQFERVVNLQNTHLLGWKSQREIGAYMAAFDVCLIPYQINHPFNHAACPTKIMDYMASTRPVVSTSIPECRLYPHLFELASDSDAYIEAVGKILKTQSSDGRTRARWEHARASTWKNTSARLLEQLLNRADFKALP